MKKISYLIVGVLTFLTFNIECFASTKTYERNENNYRVPKDVEVNSNNYNSILNTPSVNSQEKIYDFAELLSDSEEKKLYESINEYCKNTKIDSVIVTTRNLNGFELADYTYNFYDYNDFGNEGIIFVIYINPVTNKPSIFMGNNGGTSSKVFKVYDDKNINGILKYVYENAIRSGKYFEACDEYLIIAKGLYVKEYGNYRVDDEGNVVTDIAWSYIIILSVTITFIVLFISYSKFGIKKRWIDTSIKDSVNNRTMIVKKEYDRVVENSKVKI